MRHDITIKVEGEISPAHVRFETLFEILVPLELAVLRVLEGLDLHVPDTEAIFAAETIESGSFILGASVSDNVLRGLEEIGQAFYSDPTPPFLAARSELQHLHKNLMARKLSLGVGPRKQMSTGFQGFTITSTPLPFPQVREFQPTSHGVVFGTCRNLNIAKRTATVIVAGGISVILTKLSDDALRTILRHLGERLDQVYRFDGEATWNIENYAIEKMQVQSVRPVERDTRQLFESLKQAAGDTFDGMSVLKHLGSLRGGT